RRGLCQVNEGNLLFAIKCTCVADGDEQFVRDEDRRDRYGDVEWRERVERQALSDLIFLTSRLDLPDVQLPANVIRRADRTTGCACDARAVIFLGRWFDSFENLFARRVPEENEARVVG